MGLCLGLLLLPLDPASAEIIYTATLDGTTSGTDSPAFGEATLTLNDAGTEIAYRITFSGLLGVETGAHIHNAPPGEIGPRFQTLPLGSPKVGTWEVGPFEISELDAGRVYINLHTSLYLPGEIRGDVVFTSVSDEATSWGAVKALYR
jgi:hypothetical protein